MTGRAVNRANCMSRGAVDGVSSNRVWQKFRSTLRQAAENLDQTGHTLIEQLRRKTAATAPSPGPEEALRDLYRNIDPDQAAAYLKRWRTSALRSRFNAFITLARRIKRNFDGIISAVRLASINDRREALINCQAGPMRHKAWPRARRSNR